MILTVTLHGLRIAGCLTAQVECSRLVADSLTASGAKVVWRYDNNSETVLVLEPLPGVGAVCLSAPGVLTVTARALIVRPNPMPETQSLEAVSLWWHEPTTAVYGGPADVNGDGEVTDADVEAFFACLSGNCCPTCTSDFNDSGDSGEDSDIQAFVNVFAGRAPV